MSTSNTKPVEILLVEDNPGDVRLTQEALREAKAGYNMNVAMNGFDALACCRQQGQYARAERPDLVLLDLNLPEKNGFDVLQEIKTDEDLKLIPVVILTSSQAEQDITKSYQLNANAYITKPADLDQFFAVVKSIEDFWLGIVKLPLSRNS